MSVALAPGLGDAQRYAVCSFAREGRATVCWRQEYLLPAAGGWALGQQASEGQYPTSKAALEKGIILSYIAVFN